MKHVDPLVHGINIQLVKSIRMYPSLYDSGCINYGSKSTNNPSWEAISKKVGISVSEAKVRWRNLRISYIRYLRLKKQEKITKPYYLNEEMKFMQPFIRHSGSDNSMKIDKSEITYKVEQTGGPGEIVLHIRKPNDEEENDDEEDPENASMETPAHEEVVESQSHSTAMEDLVESEQEQESHTEESVYQSEEKSHFVSIHEPEQQSTENYNAVADLAHRDMAFFRSILSDVESMTPAQKARFKSDVITSINNILYS